jgi:putative addiction module component (TIGR02574 family)
MREIWDSIGPEMEQSPVSDAQRIELDRRIAALDANPADVILWEVVEAHARARFAK